MLRVLRFYMGSQKHSPKEFYPIYYGFLGLYIATAYKRGKRCFELAKNVQMWGNWRVSARWGMDMGDLP